MTKGSSGLANRVLEQILELSADAQIERRGTAKDCAAFHNLSGAITAYGKAVGLLVAIQQEQELYDFMLALSLPESVTEKVC